MDPHYQIIKFSISRPCLAEGIADITIFILLYKRYTPVIFMKITIDPQSGFCFGVVFAIKAAEEELERSGQLYCLGDIVHNNQEVERLNRKGLKVIDHKQLKDLHDCKVLIRAHGEPPETYSIALKNNIELIDASCPVVLRLQNSIRKGFEEAHNDNGQIVIYGKKGHAEVNGLVGQTIGNAVIITNESDLDKIDYHRPVYLYSQTTMSMEVFRRIVEEIRRRAGESGNLIHFIPNDSICRQVSNREIRVKLFAAQHDVIIFVSDKKSSNGTFLYSVCLSVNTQTYFISGKNELRKEWFLNADTVGISGATSTPKWVMVEISEAITVMCG
jgi:4-hydroxy-3-methylbut-2-en-1-yl diphosphate reductase